MKVILTHPTSNEFNRAAAMGLFEENMLYEFHTAIATFQGDTLDLLGGIPPFTDLRRRRQDLMLKPLTHTHPWIETGRILAQKIGWSKLNKHETGAFSVDAVYRNLDKSVGKDLNRRHKSNVDAIYAYEDGALHSFRKSKLLGISCLYDLPIGYWRASHRLLQKEKELWPEWASTLIGLNDSAAKLSDKDEELSLADFIYVASSFTASTLNDYPGKLGPIQVIPYGYPKVGPQRTYSTLNKKTLKVLFVGGLSQRKGVANLFSAADALGNRVELTIVGRKLSSACPALDIALSKHRWIPSLPHNLVLELMRQQDVLVFPSLFEGFGLVITEAMSQGTPVITTERTAGPDLINSGDNGWIIEAGSTDALQNALEVLLERPDEIARTGKNARQSALKRPWDVYGKELAESIARRITVG